MFVLCRPGEGKRLLTAVLCAIGAVITTTALSVSLTAVPLEESSALYGIGLRLAAFSKSWQNTTATGLVLFLALWFFYGKMVQKLRFLPSAAVLSVLFSLFLVVGRSYELYDSWALILGNSYQRMLALLMFVGYVIFLYLALMRFFLWLDEQSAPQKALAPPLTPEQTAMGYGICFALVLLFWLPYLVICYPGSVSTDGIYQLGQAVGATQATNHHPWFSTLLMGMFAQDGNWERGIFLYVVFHSLVCAAAFAGIAMELHRLTKTWLWPLCAIVYYGIVPTWGGYAQTYIKDTLFYGVFAAFFLCVVMVLRTKGKCGPGVWAGLFLLGILGALLRNNGLYVAVPSLLCMVLALGTRRVKLLLAGCAAGILVVYWGWSQMLTVWGVEPGSIREMLSLPFQQTARYVVECSDELTQEEIQIIDDVLDYDAILTDYDPRVADPVKNTYHGDSDALKKYFGLWVKCGLRHPDIYLEATLDMVFGYFLPGYRYGSYGGNYFLMEKPQYGIEVEFAHPTKVNAVDQYSRLWSRTPGLLLLNAPGTHSWLLILCTAALIRKRKWYGLLSTLPIWLTLGICCVSPVNGLVRYMLPVMACMPLLLGYTWSLLTGSDEKEEVQEDGQDRSVDPLLQ